MILRDYQIEIAEQAAQILKERSLVLLLMQLRTGKTITAFEACVKFRAQEILFVTKKSIISSIKDDATKFGLAIPMDVVNYEQLHKVQRGYDVVIVDEFHSFGAYPLMSERTKELKRVCRPSRGVIMLSGTPTPESFSQLYHALSVSIESPWGNYRNFYAWFKDYGTLKHKFLYNRQLNDYSDAHIDKIERDIAPITLRYTQAEAGFETVVEDRVMIVQTPAVVTQAIDRLTRDRVFPTSSGGTVLADTAVKLMMKVHQLSSGTVKTEEGEYIAFSDYKAVAIRDHFEGKKIAIFYKYIAERTHIEKVFAGRIVATPQEFNASGPDKVFVTQIQSGREGINLSAADYLVMYNIDFSALSYWQARERMNAKERTKDSVVYWVVSEGGIEKKIYDIVQKKKDFTLKHFLGKVTC